MAKRKTKPADLVPSPISAAPAAGETAETITTATTGTTPGPQVFASPPAVTAGEREVAAKVLRKNLSLGRESAEAIVGRLDDDRVRSVLAVQLYRDAPDRLRAIIET